ncbi:MAG TPA: EAL domain-containing protein, partial [Marinagarivorans sp.]
ALKALPTAQKRCIHFEITENLFLDPENNIGNLNFIKDCGFQLSMDDFGTGYSCLSYLKHFPLDCIKLDCEFTKDLLNCPVDLAITQSVINLSRDLNIELIAEGVENEATLTQLKAMGCNLIQGYYFSKPLVDNDFQEFCQQLKSC